MKRDPGAKCRIGFLLTPGEPYCGMFHLPSVFISPIYWLMRYGKANNPEHFREVLFGR